jgi:hypothetical protein
MLGQVGEPPLHLLRFRGVAMSDLNDSSANVGQNYVDIASDFKYRETDNRQQSLGAQALQVVVGEL